LHPSAYMLPNHDRVTYNSDGLLCMCRKHSTLYHKYSKHAPGSAREY
jgi:hypothetical protein